MNKLYLDILENRESLNEDNLLSIANAFNVTYDTVKGWLSATRQADGSYKLSVADIEALFAGQNIDDEVREAGKTIINSIIDSIISSLSGLN